MQFTFSVLRQSLGFLLLATPLAADHLHLPFDPDAGPVMYPVRISPPTSAHSLDPIWSGIQAKGRIRIEIRGHQIVDYSNPRRILLDGTKDKEVLKLIETMNFSVQSKEAQMNTLASQGVARIKIKPARVYLVFASESEIGNFASLRAYDVRILLPTLIDLASAAPGLRESRTYFNIQGQSLSLEGFSCRQMIESVPD